MPVRGNAPKFKPRAGATRPRIPRSRISRPSGLHRPSRGRGMHTGFHFSFGNRRMPGRRRAGCIGCALPMALALLAAVGVLAAAL